jgi:hypothetical protein
MAAREVALRETRDELLVKLAKIAETDERARITLDLVLCSLETSSLELQVQHLEAWHAEYGKPAPTEEEHAARLSQHRQIEREFFALPEHEKKRIRPMTVKHGRPVVRRMLTIHARRPACRPAPRPREHRPHRQRVASSPRKARAPDEPHPEPVSHRSPPVSGRLSVGAGFPRATGTL